MNTYEPDHGEATCVMDLPKTRFLTSQVTEIIEDALQSLGDYGEVRLVVSKGKLRFVVTACSTKCPD